MFEKYDAYKDSGVDWIGEIPNHWCVEKSKWLFSLRKEKALKNEEQLTASQKYGMIPQNEFMALEGRRVTQVEFNSEILKHVEKGDFVISMRSFQGGLEYSEYTGSVSSAYVALKPITGIFSLFFKYLFKSQRYIEALQSTSNLVRDGQALRYDNFCMVDLFLPPIEEQMKIANFLNQRIIDIDQAIAIKEQQIALLNERKQIVIQKAVTQGLDPNVPMKDSGVEWIGQIPEYWELKKIKHVTSKIGSGVTPSGGGATYLDEGIPLLRSQNIHFNRIDLNDVARISEKVHHSMSNSKVRKNDVLLNITGGSIGRCYFVETSEEMNVNQHVCILRPKKNITSIFLNAVLASEVGQGQIWYFQQGGGREGLNFQALKNFDIALPPIEEQILISKKVEEIYQQFGNMNAHIQMQIEKLKEYKTTLINDAVTGKIKVA